MLNIYGKTNEKSDNRTISSRTNRFDRQGEALVWLIIREKRNEIDMNCNNKEEMLI